MLLNKNKARKAKKNLFKKKSSIQVEYNKSIKSAFWSLFRSFQSYFKKILEKIFGKINFTQIKMPSFNLNDIFKKKTTSKEFTNLSLLRIKGRSTRRKLQSFFKPEFGLWVFAIILIFKVVFSSNGIIDYYKRNNIILSKLHKLRDLDNKNETLIKYLKDFNSDHSMQKKIVRSSLGVLARDEYLVIFSKRK
jgi:cell division protein FtsB